MKREEGGNSKYYKVFNLMNIVLPLCPSLGCRVEGPHMLNCFLVNYFGVISS